MRNRTYQFLIAILLIAAFLRLYDLPRGDTVNDEVYYGFRAVGLVDTFNGVTLQSTPLEWLDPNIPGWTNLSFHDHPPLVFYVQHFFILLFGEYPFAFRLPSALFGIASIFVLFLLARKLFSERIALISAFLLGVTVNHVYISRVGMQEAYVIFFMLLASYLFLKALERDKYFIWAGIILGLAFLTKYSAFVLLPIFFTYLVLFNHGLLRNKKFWLGLLLAAVIFSPAATYNIMLYRATGYFDLQFSSITRHIPDVWKNAAVGKQTGTFQDRLTAFIPKLMQSNSWLFLILFGGALISFLTALFRRQKETISRYGFLMISFFYITAFLLLAGPSFRFLTILTPFLALGAAIFMNAVYEKFTSRAAILYLLFAVIIVFEIFYSFNNQINYYPAGPEPWLSSKVRYENYNWGYNALDNFLDQELKNKVPAFTFEPKYKFVNTVQKANVEKALAEGRERYPAIIIYEGNFDPGAELWIFERRLLYHGWPIMSFGEYTETVRSAGKDPYGSISKKEYYIILQTNIVPPPAFMKLVAGQKPAATIYNPRGQAVFEIYKTEALRAETLL